MPRLLFRYVVLGLDERVARSRDAIFSCLLCRACEASCPSGVHISENVRELRPLAAHGGLLMPLALADVVGILEDNLRRRGSVLPIPARRATRWARDLGIPRGGETVLYTGQMYQLIPYIERLVRLEQRIGDSPLARLSGLARRANRLVNGVGAGGAAERRGAARVRSRPGQRRAACSAALASTSATSTRTTSTAGRWPTTWAPTRRSRRTPGGSHGSSASTGSGSSSPSIPTPPPCCAPSTRASSRASRCGSGATSRCSRSAVCGWPRRSAVRWSSTTPACTPGTRGSPRSRAGCSPPPV